MATDFHLSQHTLTIPHSHEAFVSLLCGNRLRQNVGSVLNEANEKERVGGQASVNNSHHACSGVFLLQFSSFIGISSQNCQRANVEGYAFGLLSEMTHTPVLRVQSLNCDQQFTCWQLPVVHSASGVLS